MANLKLLTICASHQARDEISLWIETFRNNLIMAVSQLSGTNVNLEVSDAASINLELLQNTHFKILIADNDFEKVFTDICVPQNTFLVFPFGAEGKPIPRSFLSVPVYSFADIDPETGLQRVYSAADEGVASLYWSKILTLTYDVFHLNKSGTEVSKQELVYVAQTTPDMYTLRDAVCSELVQRGLKVLPGHLLQGSYNEVSNLVTEMLSKCCMSVHILGPNYGQVLPGNDYSLPELQYRLAAKAWRFASQNKDAATFHYVVWMPPFMPAADDKQRMFVESLRIEEKDESSEVLQVPLEELKSTLRNKIEIFRNPHAGKNENNQPGVYVVYELKNKENAMPLISCLQQKGIEVLDIHEGVNTENIVARHFKMLSRAGSVIVCDFNSPAHWVHSKFKDIVKAPGYGRSSAFIIKAVYSNNQSRYSFSNNSDFVVINANENPKEALAPFFQKLNL